MKCVLFLLSVLLPLSLRAEPLVAWNPVGFGIKDRKNPIVWNETRKNKLGEDIGRVVVTAGVRLVDGLRLGSGMTRASVNNCWGGLVPDDGVQGLDASVAAGRYFTFTIAPEPDRTLSLDGLLMNVLLRQKTTFTYQWQYSVNGGEFVNITPEPLTVVGSFSGVESKGQILPEVDLTGIEALQNVKSPVTFRLVFWKVDGEKTKDFYAFLVGRLPGDDFVVTGTVH